MTIAGVNTIEQLKDKEWLIEVEFPEPVDTCKFSTPGETVAAKSNGWLWLHGWTRTRAARLACLASLLLIACVSLLVWLLSQREPSSTKEAISTRITAAFEAGDLQSARAATVELSLRKDLAEGELLPTVQRWIEILRYGSDEERVIAAKGCGDLGVHAKLASGALVDIHAAENGAVVEAARKALVKIGPSAADAILARKGTSDDAHARRLAATFGQMGKPILPILLEKWALQSTKAYSLSRQESWLRLAIEHLPSDCATVLAKQALSDASSVPVADDEFSFSSFESDAFDILRLMGPAAAAAVPHLREWYLIEENEDVRQSIVYLLEGMGSPSAVDALVEIAEINKFGYRPRIYLRQAPRIGAEAFLPSLIKGPTDDVFLMRLNSLGGLARFAPYAPKETIPTMIGALDHADVETAKAAANCFVWVTFLLQRQWWEEGLCVPPHAFVEETKCELAKALPKLVSLSRRGDPEARDFAATAIGWIGEECPSAISEAHVLRLTELLEDEDDSAQQAAIEALGRLGSAAASSLPALNVLANGDDEQLSALARIVAAGIQGDPTRVLDLVREFREEGDLWDYLKEDYLDEHIVRLLTIGSKDDRQVIQALLAIREEGCGTGVMQALRRVAESDETFAFLVQQLESKSELSDDGLKGLFYAYRDATQPTVSDERIAIALPLVLRSLESADLPYERTGIRLLGHVGPPGPTTLDVDLHKAAVQRLTHIRQDIGSETGTVWGSANISWIAALESLAKIDPTNPKHVRDLQKMLSVFPEAAADALGNLGLRAKCATPSLEQWMHADRATRLAVATALWRIDRRHEALMPLLLEDLEHGDKVAKLDAIRLLAELGPVAKPAVPALHAQRKIVILRAEIQLALSSIEGETKAED